METITEPPAGDPAPAPPPGAADDTDRRVVGGVAWRVAASVGVDPLWVRLGFVALTLVDGLGVALYAALWLVVVAGRRPGRTTWVWMVAAGAVLYLWTQVDLDLDRPLAWIVLLAGGALALWQPRTEVIPVGDRGGTPPPTIEIPRWTPRPRRIVPPERSVLGRAAFGLALLVAAAGALIDHLNDGRLHPEQWLGAAAAVCGLGLVVSAWRGRAWWLIVPAALFAGTGWGAGHAARAGVDTLRWDDEDVLVSDFTAPGAAYTRRAAAGTVWVGVYGAPDDGAPVIVDARVGIGDVSVAVDDDVTVEIRTDVHDGRVTLDGRGSPSRLDDESTFRLGPEGAPDVMVRAEVSRGDVLVRRFDGFDETPPPAPPFDGSATTQPPLDGQELSEVREIGEGLLMTSDGTVIVSENVAVLSPDGDIWLADGSTPVPGGVTRVAGMAGEYLILPDQTVVTPTGAVIDLAAVRAESNVIEAPADGPVATEPSASTPGEG